jgi:hypothetical protein
MEEIPSRFSKRLSSTRHDLAGCFFVCIKCHERQPHPVPLAYFLNQRIALFKNGLSSMTGTVPDLVRSTHARTKLPATFVNQRAREIQNAGLLPLAKGSAYARARPRDLVNLLLALSADKVRHAPATVNQYANLKRLVERDHANAGDALEELVTRIWSGDRNAADKTVRIVQSWPEIIITERDDDQHSGEHFYGDGQIMEFHALFDVRRSLEIPGRVIAQIGGDLGMRGCQYAI